jgi:hypothetical protein
MSFTPKKVDDRTFEDLVTEAKRRIAAYMPEWTDHNESDPGIMLVQLFAWLTEVTLFRLNRVPDERMYVAFLDLMGLSPRPAVPAQALVSFEMSLGAQPVTLQPSELALSASGPDGEIAFEPDAPVPLIPAALGAVLVDDGVSPQRLDVTTSNRSGASYQPFGDTLIQGRALYLGLDADPQIAPAGSSVNLQILVRASEKEIPPRPASTSFPVENEPLDGDLTWEGKTSQGWVKLTQLLDETSSLKKTGLLTLELPGSLIASQEPGDREKKARFWIRARAKQGSEPERRKLVYIAINGARARQWRTYPDETLFPGSDGTPDQTRRVLHPILLDEHDPPVVTIDERDGEDEPRWVEWSQVDSLATRLVRGKVLPEGVPAPVFALSRSGTTVLFGDGRDGLIPIRGTSNIRITYRSGGGKRGNVAAGKLKLAKSPPGVSGVVQREAATLGDDEEPVELAARRAPDEIRAGDRAVTAKDFVTIAERDGGARRAIAVNRHNPMLPDVPLTGALTLVVIPPRVDEAKAPRPTQAFLDHVANAIEPRRVLTTELFVVAPVYERIDVDLEIDIKNAAEAPHVRARVDCAVRTFLDPIVGGPDGDGWPLGGTLVHGELMSAVLRAEGVVLVNSMTVRHQGAQQPPCADVALDARLALIEVGEIRIKLNAPGARR